MPSDDFNPLRLQTRCARVQEPVNSATRPLVPPLSLGVVGVVSDLEQIDALYEGRAEGLIYARDGHAEAERFARKIASLEGAEAAWATGSGMAAEAAVFLAALSGGDHVALAEGLYGKTIRLVRDQLTRFGVSYDLFDPTHPKSLEQVLTPATKLVFVETISNPLLRVADIPGLAALTRPRGIALAVDHTFGPLLGRPLTWGADLVIHSATKLIGGHSDLTLGVVAGSRGWIDRIAPVVTTFGLSAAPMDCWLASRGLATLALRVERACANALTLARRLQAHPQVRAVHYPGLESHPDHQRACTLLSGFGAMVTLDVGGRPQADHVIRRLAGRIPFAPSLGDTATTLSHPATTSHRGLRPEDWARQGIHPGLIRLSIGLEAVDDLTAELNAALDGLEAVPLPPSP